MNAPELVVSANANRRVPGVNVPVAAPSCALPLAREASCLSVLAPAEGNCPRCGCSAAGSSETAGGGPALDCELEATCEGPEEVLLVDDPHAVRSRGTATSSTATN